MRTALAAALACLAVAGAPLVEVARVELPQVVHSASRPSQRIDHLACADGRAVVCALGNGSVEVVDLATKKVVKRFDGLDEPQGVAFVATTQQLAFTTGGDGKLHVVDMKTLAEVRTLDAGGDADNVRFDAKAGRLWVGCEEGLAVFTVADWKRVATVRLPGHAESFQLAQDGSRLFVNVPTAQSVCVVDRSALTVTATWKLAGAKANFPMALDERGGRLLIGCRDPAAVVALDLKDGKEVARTPIGGDTDDLFVDATRQRVYVSCGAGVVDVLANDAKLTRVGEPLATARGARTSLFVATSNQLLVAVPAQGTQAAQLLVLEARE